MNRVDVQIEEDRTAYLPGEELRGQVEWHLPEVPDSLQLHLLWYTSGKGSQNVGAAQTVEFDGVGASGVKPFRILLPAWPYSFSGKLISLIWALELVAKPGDHTARKEIVISPSGAEIELSVCAT